LRILIESLTVGLRIAGSLTFVEMGETLGQAIRCLVESIEMQVEEYRESKNLANLFRPADAKFFQMFAAGRDIETEPIDMHFDNVDLENAETREYSDDDLVCT
jgi:hypothetical protein